MTPKSHEHGGRDDLKTANGHPGARAEEPSTPQAAPVPNGITERKPGVLPTIASGSGAAGEERRAGAARYGDQ